MKISKLVFTSKIALATLLFIRCIPACGGQISTQFNFTVNIAAGTCDAELPDTVDMGEIYTTELMPSGKHGPKKGFDITLTNCVWVSGVKVQMDGEAASSNPDYFAITESGDETSATGIALEITDNTEEIIRPSQETNVYNIVQGSASTVLHFDADYVSVMDNITSGTANVTMTVSFDYE